MPVQCLLSQPPRSVMEGSPRLLKDCLLQDSNSSSSNGFSSFPRHPLRPSPLPKPNKDSPLLPIKTFHALINAVKSLRFTAIISPPSILPRSLSRRLSKKVGGKTTDQAAVTVRVKDIVRWRSSRDMQEDVSPPLDFEPSTVTTTTTGSTPSGTPCSSWCDSDFTSDNLPSWGGKFEEYGEEDVGKDRCEIGKNDLRCVGEDSCTVADTEVGPQQKDLQCNGEEDDSSPVSVLEIQCDEDDDSPQRQCLENAERTKQKLMHTIKRFESLAKIIPFDLDEWVPAEKATRIQERVDTELDCTDDDYSTGKEEEIEVVEVRAHKLWNRVKEGRVLWIHEEHLIMDFFRDELMTGLNSHHNTFRDWELENRLVSAAKEWTDGGRDSEIEYGSLEQRRKACLDELERGDWNEKQMEEEQGGVAAEIEDGLFSLLMGEVITEISA